MSKKRMQGLAILLLLVILAENGIPISFSQRSPSYTVDVSISNQRITKPYDSRVNVTFTISGLGDFRNGTVKVHSDAAGLLVNTSYLKGFYVGTNEVISQWLDEYPRANSEEKATTAQYTFRGINCEWLNDYDICSHYSTYTSAIKIVGSLILDLSATDPGSYRLEVAFVAYTAGTDHKFDNSVSYEVLDSWQAYFWVPFTILAAILLIAVAVLVSRRLRRSLVSVGALGEHLSASHVLSSNVCGSFGDRHSLSRRPPSLLEFVCAVSWCGRSNLNRQGRSGFVCESHGEHTN